MDRMVALFTRDLRYRDVAMGVTNRTAAELCAFGESLFASFPDATFELCSSVANGYRDTAEWIMRGTHKGDVPGAPATGKAVEISGASVFEFERDRSEEHTSELQSLMRISYAVFGLKKKKTTKRNRHKPYG